jgi:probable phosphoglycerate mutase
MTFLLVRHAMHSDYGRRLSGRSQAPLTAEGRRQAVALGAMLATEGIDAVHTSPCLRAVETARAVAGAAGARLEISEALDEIDFGAWTGSAFSSLESDPHWMDWNARRSASRPPGGESMAEAADRIAAHMERLVRERPDLTVALVTHADMIRGLVARCLGLPLDNLLRMEVGPASVTRIEAGPWGMKLVSLNESAARAMASAPCGCLGSVAEEAR